MGGEEFIAVLPGTPTAGAAIVGEHIRAAIENNIEHLISYLPERSSLSGLTRRELFTRIKNRLVEVPVPGGIAVVKGLTVSGGISTFRLGDTPGDVYVAGTVATAIMNLTTVSTTQKAGYLTTLIGDTVQLVPSASAASAVTAVIKSLAAYSQTISNGVPGKVVSGVQMYTTQPDPGTGRHDREQGHHHYRCGDRRSKSLRECDHCRSHYRSETNGGAEGRRGDGRHQLKLPNPQYCHRRNDGGGERRRGVPSRRDYFIRHHGGHRGCPRPRLWRRWFHRRPARHAGSDC